MANKRIVVGVDGSSGAAAAVRWAAAEARLRGTDLRVLTAYQRHPDGPGSPASRQRPGVSAAAAALIHAAVTQARAVAPGVEVRGMALPGYAVPALLHAEEDAELLVVGSHRGGSVPGLPHGSVCSQVATHARGSVVVVRGQSDPDSGPVVAGVSADPDRTVLDRAFAEAALRGAPVVAVTVTDGRPEAGAADDLAPWRAKFPRVAAEREVLSGRPDRVLVQRCRHARLAVVGPRRRGFEGVLLGVVGTRLLQQAECPVLVARR